MRYALISDIHGNREALAAVLEDAAGRGVQRYVVLGDVVGYGPDPAWCISRVREMEAAGAVVIQGNHDAAIAGSARDMNPVARAAIDWTRPRLSPEDRAWLEALPLTVSGIVTEAASGADTETISGAASGAASEAASGAGFAGEMLFTHASAHCPADWIYITSERGAMASFRSAQARLIFCGHVHVPALYSYDHNGRTHCHQVKPGAPVPLLSSRRWLAVAGSVGQPRDGNAAAGWLLFDSATTELSFRRTPYDVALTAQKIRAAGLPGALAERLSEGR